MNAGQIILKQLGGANRLAAMIGASNIGYGEKHLVFRFKGIRQMNMIRIDLNASDLYDVHFFKFSDKTYKMKVIEVIEDVFAEDLKSSIEKATGLYLSL